MHTALHCQFSYAAPRTEETGHLEEGEREGGGGRGWGEGGEGVAGAEVRQCCIVCASTAQIVTTTLTLEAVD